MERFFIQGLGRVTVRLSQLDKETQSSSQLSQPMPSCFCFLILQRLYQIKFTHYRIDSFKGYSSVAFSILELCKLYLSRFENIFIPPPHPRQEKFPMLYKPPHFSQTPSPRQPLLYFLFLYICLLQTFHRTGITRYVAFCVWLLSLSMMFLRFS